MEKYPEIGRIHLWEMAEIFNKFIQNTKKFKHFNYPQDKLLNHKQEQKLLSINNELDSETTTIDAFVLHYLKNYL